MQQQTNVKKNDCLEQEIISSLDFIQIIMRHLKNLVLKQKQFLPRRNSLLRNFSLRFGNPTTKFLQKMSE